MTQKNSTFLTLWILGMGGVIAVNLLVVPGLVAGQELPFSLEVALLIATIQSSLLLALAAWGGSRLSEKIGLQAPAIQALVERKPFVEKLRVQFWPGILGGIGGALVLIVAAVFVPEQLKQAGQEAFPLLVKLLYGGITEEILLRWGVMSLFVWFFGLLIKNRSKPPFNIVYVAAIFFSALLFALGHLPAAGLVAGEALTIFSVLYVIVFNSLFGFVAGFLFWRYGLEAAIIAHFGAHLFSHYFVL